MSKFIRATLNSRNELRCKGAFDFIGHRMDDISFKIDTGCNYTCIPLKRTTLDDVLIEEMKHRDYLDPRIEKVVSFGVNDTDEKRESDISKFRAGNFNDLASVSVRRKVSNLTIDGCNLGKQEIFINYTRTGNILIGMDILSKLDIHIGKTSEGETVFLACPLDRINDEYLLEVERLFNTGSDIQAVQIRNSTQDIE